MILLSISFLFISCTEPTLPKTTTKAQKGIKVQVISRTYLKDEHTYIYHGSRLDTSKRVWFLHKDVVCKARDLIQVVILPTNHYAKHIYVIEKSPITPLQKVKKSILLPPSEEKLSL